MSISIKDSTESMLNMPLEKLICRSDAVRKEHIGNRIELCGIINAKSGRCGEDCKFCAQSASHHTDISVYPLKKKENIIEAAHQAKAIGADKFGIVTSGNKLTGAEVQTIAEATSEITEMIGIDVCASLGALQTAQLELLKANGLSVYHHNIETSRHFYPMIVSTHTFDERIETIISAKEAGLKVCSGGIIGMGETWADRIDMAQTLKELNVDSVPINILIPVEGTALENIEAMSIDDVIRTICIFRIILEDKAIKIAAGREATLKDSQAKVFQAGANGMIIGGYLTVKGATVANDNALIEEVMKLWTK